MTTVCLCLSLLFLIIFHKYVEFNFQSAPLTHCLAVLDESEIANRYSLKYNNERNESLLTYFEHCRSDYCKKIVRVCAENEEPTDMLIIILPVLTGLLLVSLGASVVLQYLGDYEKVYWFAKKLGLTFIHYTFLQDVLRDQCGEYWKEKKLQLIEEACKDDMKIINRKGKLSFK